MIDSCARLGVVGLELLGAHFESTARGDLHALKQLAFRNGVALIAVSALHNFATPDRDQRQREIDILCRWVDVACELGAPAVRAFGGRWATRPSFTEFMAAGGEEPPLAGYTDDDGYAWVVESFQTACDHAGPQGVTVALENHWGFTGSAAGVLRILRDTGSPWLKVLLDTGNFNFCGDPYVEMAEIAPHAVLVHAKTYCGGGIYYTAELDYRRIARILSDAGYRGYLSIEFEGRSHPNQGIPESLALLRRAFTVV